MPEPRATGPDWPSARASSADRSPTPFVRASQIGFSLSIDSYWSTAAGITSQNSRYCGKKPRGMSSARPPTWK